jgi:hypothetical protein
MKTSKRWLVAAALSVPAIVFAQNSGGGSSNGNANGPGGGAGGAGMTAPNQAGADMAASGSHTSKSHKKMSTHSHKKPATDTTNTPGADSSSDTKGQ